MAPRTRKQREIHERHGLILDVARRLLLERGYLGLTMDRIAAATEYSKGTIYQHFSCKEEVVISLVIETAKIRAALYERAATFQGGTRERLTAVGAAAEQFVRRYPDHFQSELVIRTSSVRQKCSAEKQVEMAGCEQRCMQVVTGIVQSGIAAGDLTLPDGLSPGDLTFGLWSMYVGAFVLAASDAPIDQLGVTDPARALNETYARFLDGYGWRPLSTEWDYDAKLERVYREVFPEALSKAAPRRSAPAVGSGVGSGSGEDR